MDMDYYGLSNRLIAVIFTCLKKCSFALKDLNPCNFPAFCGEIV